MFADILEQHAGEIAFLWSLRDASALAPHYDASGLAALDERLDAHLDGLRIAGDQGLAASTSALDADEPGSVFAVAVIASERADIEGLEPALALAEESPKVARALAAALAWVPFHTARPALERLLRSNASPSLRRAGIAASAAHRRDPGEPLAWAALDDDVRLSARAFRAAGELARLDLLSVLREHVRAPQEERRFWAAWSASLVGDSAAIEALWAIASAGGRFATRACTLAVRGLEVREARARIEHLGAVAEAVRTAIAGAEALGDPASVPWLFGLMETPSLARPAAEAVAAITGVTIEGDLAGAAPKDFQEGPSDDPRDPEVAMSADRNLPWPAVENLRAWWKSREKGFRRGFRYLAGVPVSADIAQAVLRDGTQKRRASAALEMALMRPGRPLFEVRVHEKSIT